MTLHPTDHPSPTTWPAPAGGEFGTTFGHAWLLTVLGAGVCGALAVGPLSVVRR